MPETKRRTETLTLCAFLALAASPASACMPTIGTAGLSVLLALSGLVFGVPLMLVISGLVASVRTAHSGPTAGRVAAMLCAWGLEGAAVWSLGGKGGISQALMVLGALQALILAAGLALPGGGRAFNGKVTLLADPTLFRSVPR